MEARSSKKAPEVKPWVRRMAEVSGVELAKFLNFCKGLPGGTDLRHGMEGYGRFLKGAEPPLPDWRLEQVREALRLFQRGIHGWRIGKADEKGEVTVDFRVKTAGEKAEEQTAETRSPVDGSTGAGARGDWLVKADGLMRVQRLARRLGTRKGRRHSCRRTSVPKSSPHPTLPPRRQECRRSGSFFSRRPSRRRAINKQRGWRREHAGICAGGLMRVNR